MWSPARNLDNMWELEFICNQVKRFQKDGVQVDDAHVEEGNLQFLKEDYKDMSTDVIACGIAKTEDYIDGKLYFYATVGKYDNCYFLLDQFLGTNFYPNRHDCVLPSVNFEPQEYNRLEDKFIAHFGSKCLY